jgi:hypothetical protein
VPTDRHEDLAGLLRALRGSNNTSVHINAGGIGVGLSAALTVMSFAAAAAMFWALSEVKADMRKLDSDTTAEISDLKRDLQVSKDYLSAIYMQAPHLKPKDEE